MANSDLNIDPTLLKACKEGDERGHYKLYQLCYQCLYGVCRRYVNDEDQISLLLNNAFVKMIDGLRKYDTNIPFEPWMRRIAINTAIDYHRRNKRYKEMITYPDPDSAEETLREAEYNSADMIFDAEQLLNFVRALPPVTGEVFNLFAVDGYSHKEIGDMLTIRVGTSKWHLSNARKLLKEMIEAELKSVKIAKPRGLKSIKKIIKSNL